MTKGADANVGPAPQAQDDPEDLIVAREMALKLDQERHLRFEETAQLTRLAESLRAQLTEARAENTALRASTSWRITAPIRMLKRALGAARGR